MGFTSDILLHAKRELLHAISVTVTHRHNGSVSNQNNSNDRSWDDISNEIFVDLIIDSNQNTSYNTLEIEPNNHNNSND